MFVLVSASTTPLFKFWRFLLSGSSWELSLKYNIEVFLLLHEASYQNTNRFPKPLRPPATLQSHVILKNDYVKVVIVQRSAERSAGVSYNIGRISAHHVCAGAGCGGGAGCGAAIARVALGLVPLGLGF